MSAASSYIQNKTGASVDHAAAVRLMAHDSQARQAAFGRVRNAEPAPRASQCHQATAAHSRFEVTLSDFGVLDLAHTEDDPTPRAIDEALTPMLRTAARLWPRAWRIGIAAVLVIGSIALAGCGGGHPEDDEAEFTPALVGASIPGIPTRDYAYDNDTTQFVVVNAPAKACNNVLSTGAACVLITTPADTPDERLRRHAAANQPGVHVCDLNRTPPDLWAADLAQCAQEAIAARFPLQVRQ